ncbi:MAG: helix-turn-helix domain-containing protein, partial [Ruthenibacterium sp.]
SFRHVLLSEVLMDVLGSDSIPEIRNYISHYLERLFAILREQDETRQTAELIDRVKNYIQEHFAENLTLTVLSELFYICPAYLSRLFKKKTGVNFVEYLTNLRITKGKEFLADSSLMIYTVSEMVGYENPRYFSRLFKESVGCSPQEYRNKLQ